MGDHHRPKIFGAVPQTDPGRTVVTALAQQTADQLGVNLADVEGTGKDGRVTKGDVEAYAAARDTAPQPQPEPATVEDAGQPG